MTDVVDGFHHTRHGFAVPPSPLERAFMPSPVGKVAAGRMGAAEQIFAEFTAIPIRIRRAPAASVPETPSFRLPDVQQLPDHG